jgi:hypothetical protein
LDFAVAKDFEKIFNSSSHSFISGCRARDLTSPDSIKSSNQNSVSSVSSVATLIFEMKSAAERARQAAR